jgi:hypothetical protein
MKSIDLDKYLCGAIHRPLAMDAKHEKIVMWSFRIEPDIDPLRYKMITSPTLCQGYLARGLYFLKAM